MLAIYLGLKILRARAQRSEDPGLPRRLVESSCRVEAGGED
jgi:hypothetical protein